MTNCPTKSLGVLEAAPLIVSVTCLRLMSSLEALNLILINSTTSPGAATLYEAVTSREAVKVPAVAAVINWPIPSLSVTVAAWPEVNPVGEIVEAVS